MYRIDYLIRTKTIEKLSLQPIRIIAKQAETIQGHTRSPKPLRQGQGFRVSGWALVAQASCLCKPKSSTNPTESSNTNSTYRLDNAEVSPQFLCPETYTELRPLAEIIILAIFLGNQKLQNIYK